MDQAVNWRNEISAIAGDFLPTDTKQSWLGRAARRCGLSLRYAQELYYGRITDPKHSVASRVLSEAEQARIEEARRDALKIADVYSRRAEALASIDEDFHRSDIDALVAAARILCGSSRARD